MPTKLTEDYQGRIRLSEQYFVEKHGEKISALKKAVMAQCLDNTAKKMNEAFANMVGVQKNDLGRFKTFN